MVFFFWIQSGNLVDFINFKKQRAVCVKLSKNVYREYIDNIEKNSRRNIKAFWKYVKNLSYSSTIVDNMFLGDKTSKSTAQTCNLFATYFSKSYMKHDPFYHDCGYYDVPLYLEINCEEIFHAINNLKVSGEPGIDGISSVFVKQCGTFLLNPLRILFNLSITSGIMPQIWKNSFIFKAGDRSDISNYRPISLSCPVAKIFDSIMSKRIYEGFIQCVTKEQHGFIKRRSTFTNLLIYSDYISNSLVSSKQVDSIYLDFRKAFDSVDHDIMIMR